jgi:uncharacterized protein YcbK (DUF882 family)
VAGAHGTQDAIANGDTRTLSLVHIHTKEAASITFRRNGQYDSKALEQLNWMLRDWRRDEATRMDPRLFDIVWEVHRSLGSQEPIQVMSAYRSPATNSMLRRRSRGVAKHSQHMEGKAMDFHMPDVSMERVRALAMRLQRGGVGYYPSAYTPFVHLDAGSVRSWPRMTRDQLARLFPDGRTVHIPADGRPLAGYEEARAEILARGGAVAGYAAYAAVDEETAAQPKRRSLWATLFGGAEDDEDSEYLATIQPRGRQAPVRTASAYAPTGSNDVDMMAAFRSPAPIAQPQSRVAAVPPAPPPPPLPEPEPIRPVPAPVRVAAIEPPPVTPPASPGRQAPPGSRRRLVRSRPLRPRFTWPTCRPRRAGPTISRTCPASSWRLPCRPSGRPASWSPPPNRRSCPCAPWSPPRAPCRRLPRWSTLHPRRARLPPPR